MKIIDATLAVVSGLMVGMVAGSFFQSWRVIGFFWVAFPVFSLVFLEIAYVVGRRALFVLQAAKHLLVGAFATVVDVIFFEWLLSVVFLANPLIIKSISFLVSTVIKYAGNKYWAFEKREREGMHKEAAQFFIITLAGLVIDVSVFYCATKLVGPRFNVSSLAWVRLSVIFAAFAAAAWNFLGYKFLVFKK